MFYVICVIYIYEHSMYISHIHVYSYGTEVDAVNADDLAVITNELSQTKSQLNSLLQIKQSTYVLNKKSCPL